MLEEPVGLSVPTGVSDILGRPPRVTRGQEGSGHNFTVGARKTWTESLVGGSRVVPLASRFSETVILLYFILHSNTCGGCAIGARACVLVRLWETSACPLGVPLVGDGCLSSTTQVSDGVRTCFSFSERTNQRKRERFTNEDSTLHGERRIRGSVCSVERKFVFLMSL